VSALDFESDAPFSPNHLAVDNGVPHFDAVHVDFEPPLPEMPRNSPLKPSFIRHSLTLPEIPLVSFLGDEGEAALDQVDTLLLGCGDFADPVICFEVD
jgi:hypothetical protein